MRALLLWLTAGLALGAGELRIASYSPGATQTLIDLGCSAEIAMATRWCPLPKEHPAPRSADVFLPDLERLLQAKPDLVILPRMANPLWADKCAKAGLRTLVLTPESRDSVSRDIMLIGEATGRAAAATKLADQLMKKPVRALRTILVVWDGVMAGPESYLAEPLAGAAFRSALPQGAWIKFDWELLATAKPDAVLWIENTVAGGPIVGSPGKAAEMSRIPVVKDLPCLKNKRIYQAESGSNWLPGSGLAKLNEALSTLRHDLE